MKATGLGLALAVARELRAVRPEPGLQDIADFETDALAGFVLARAAALFAGADATAAAEPLFCCRSWR